MTTITDDFSFGEWLLDTMEEQGIKTMELAELSKITPAGIRNLLYENRRPRIDTMFALADALGKKIVFMDKEDEDE